MSIDLEAIRARAAAATPGPWDAKAYRVHVPGPDRILAACWRPWGDVADITADVEFIAAARTDVPALLEAVDRLRDMLVDAETEAQMQAAEVERLRALIDRQDAGAHA